jgi:hypothetical protein
MRLTTGRTLFSVNRQVAGILRAALLLFFTLLTCGRIADMVRPFEHTTVKVCGYVSDGIFGSAVVGAEVVVAGVDGPVVTDEDGYFCFGSVPTGKRKLRVSLTGYVSEEVPVDVTIDPEVDTVRLVREDGPPLLDTIRVGTEQMRFADDEVLVVFRATDSSGGIIGAVLVTGDTGAHKSISIHYDDTVYNVQDTFTYCYRVFSDSFTAVLRVIGARGDTVVDTISVVVPQLRRPTFALIREDEEGFISGYRGFLSIYVEDPDNVMERMSLDWDTTSDGDTMISTVPYWSPRHTYSFSGSGEIDVPVKINIFDDEGCLVNDTTYELQVLLVSPPELDNEVFYFPGDYLAPTDTAILIGVRINEIEDSWVQKIRWFINESDPSCFFYHQEVYTEEQAPVNTPAGNLFVHEFSVVGLKRINEVTIEVFDHYNNSSSISGSFIIAGKQ